MQLHREITRFSTARLAEGLSPRTVEQQNWYLTQYAEWIRDQAATRDLLRSWAASIRTHWAPATCRGAVCAVRALYRWLADEQILNHNPAQALKLPPVPRRVQRTITLDEITAMLKTCDTSTLKGSRDLALLNLLIDTGLRAAEVCRLQLADVDLNRSACIVTIKGGAQDLAYFGTATTQSLTNWIDTRPAAPGVTTLLVSVGGATPGHPLTPRGLRVIVKRVGEIAGVKAVSPHAFRRGFAVIATQAGAPTRTVQLAGRWSDIRMVERYTAALARGGLHRQWSPADQVQL